MKKLLLHSLMVTFALASLNANAAKTLLEEYNDFIQAKKDAQKAYDDAQALPATDGNKATSIATAEQSKKTAEDNYNQFIDPVRLQAQYNKVQEDIHNAARREAYLQKKLVEASLNAHEYEVLAQGCEQAAAIRDQKQQELTNMQRLCDAQAAMDAIEANQVAKAIYLTKVNADIARIAGAQTQLSSIANHEQLKKYGIIDDQTLADARTNATGAAIPANVSANVKAEADTLIAKWEQAFAAAGNHQNQKNMQELQAEIDVLEKQIELAEHRINDGKKRSLMLDDEGNPKKNDKNENLLNASLEEDRKNAYEAYNQELELVKNAKERGIELQKQIEDLAKQARISLNGVPVASNSFKDIGMALVHCNHPFAALTMTTAYWLLAQNKIETTPYISNEVLKKRLAKAILGGFGAASVYAMINKFGPAMLQGHVNNGWVVGANYVAIDMATRYAYDKFAAKADVQDATVDDTDEEDEEELSVFTQDNAKQFGAFLGNVFMAGLLCKGEALLKLKITG